AADPIFSIQVADNEVEVRVLSGSMKVTWGSGDPVALGPNQQVSIPTDGVPMTLPFAVGEIPPHQGDAMTAYLKVQPKPDFGRPATAGSTQLPKLFARGTLVVGLDANGLDDQARGFVRAFADFLASSWRVKLD